QMYDLHLKAIPGSGQDKTTEMIVNVVKDALVKADEKAGKIIDLRQLQEITQVLGKEQAQQLLAGFVKNGGVDISRFLAGGPNAAPARPQPAAQPAQPAGAAAAEERPQAAQDKGDGMNGIAQQVYQTPFFKDLLEIWGGHLRMGRSPFLFSNQMAGYM